MNAAPLSVLLIESSTQHCSSFHRLTTGCYHHCHGLLRAHDGAVHAVHPVFDRFAR